MSVEQQAANLDHRTDAILDEFDAHFSSVLSRAQVRTVLNLRSKLSFTKDDTVAGTAANVRVIRALPQIFRQALRSEGYDTLASSFLQSFDGGLTILDDILRTITNGYQLKPVTFSNSDYAYFDQLKAQVSFNLEDAVSQVAEIARRNVMFTMAGNPFTKTAAVVAERLHIALGEASSLAATGISTFYRTIADKGYQQIEDELEPAGKTLEYTYVGPLDKLNRPFCKRLTTQARSGKTWTRAQIDSMNNGQLPDVFRTCGGYRCRHQWAVALDR